MVRSGGEWISSIALENAAVGHPALAEAAVIAAPHPKWGERPLLVAVRRPGAEVDKAEILEFLRRQGRQVVAAGRCGVRRRAAAHGDRQDQEIRAARAVPGLPAADRLRRSALLLALLAGRRGGRNAAHELLPERSCIWPRPWRPPGSQSLSSASGSVAPRGIRSGDPGSCRAPRPASARVAADRRTRAPPAACSRCRSVIFMTICPRSWPGCGRLRQCAGRRRLGQLPARPRRERHE